MIVVGNLNSVGVQPSAEEMLTGLALGSTSGSSGKKGSLCITPSYSEEKTTVKVSALNDPFLMPMVILKWLRTGVALLFLF